MAAAPDRYELHFADETHVDTNPRLAQCWHRCGQQAIVPAAGTNRRLSIIGSVTHAGHGSLALLTARADSAAFGRYLAMLDTRHAQTDRQIILVLDNGSCHTSRMTQAAVTARQDWLEVIALSRYSPELNPIERDWRWFKQEQRGHLASSLAIFVTELVTGLATLGGERCTICNEVPAWWLAGHKREPTGRPVGRPVGATDRQPRKPRGQNISALT